MNRTPTFLEKLLAWAVIAAILSAFLPGCTNNRAGLAVSGSLAAEHRVGSEWVVARVEVSNQFSTRR